MSVSCGNVGIDIGSTPWTAWSQIGPSIDEHVPRMALLIGEERSRLQSLKSFKVPVEVPCFEHLAHLVCECAMMEGEHVRTRMVRSSSERFSNTARCRVSSWSHTRLRSHTHGEVLPWHSQTDANIGVLRNGMVREVPDGLVRVELRMNSGEQQIVIRTSFPPCQGRL